MKKIKLLIIIVSLLLSLKYTYCYFNNNYIIKNSIKTNSYKFNIYDINKDNININNNIVNINPNREGYDLLGYSNKSDGSIISTDNSFSINELNNKDLYAIWKIRNYNIKVITYVDNVKINPNNRFNFNMNISNNSFNNLISYDNMLDYNSNINIHVNDTNGYNIVGDKDINYIVKDNREFNINWIDNIEPTINNINVENLGFYDPSAGPKKGYNIMIRIDAVDYGVGIKTYYNYLLPYNKGSGANKVEGSNRYMDNVLYLNTSEGRTFCAEVIDYNNNVASKCVNVHF